MWDKNVSGSEIENNKNYTNTTTMSIATKRPFKGGTDPSSQQAATLLLVPDIVSQKFTHKANDTIRLEFQIMIVHVVVIGGAADSLRLALCGRSRTMLLPLVFIITTLRWSRCRQIPILRRLLRDVAALWAASQEMATCSKANICLSEYRARVDHTIFCAVRPFEAVAAPAAVLTVPKWQYS
jgi:hypothetical protein